jgi:hypothetical protein
MTARGQALVARAGRRNYMVRLPLDFALTGIGRHLWRTRRGDWGNASAGQGRSQKYIYEGAFWDTCAIFN